MQRLLIAGLVGVGIVALVYGIDYLAQPLEVENTPQVIEQTDVPELEEVEQDIIDNAQRELERINSELDAKETELLEERSRIDAELERLRETRTSFR